MKIVNNNIFVVKTICIAKIKYFQKYVYTFIASFGIELTH